MDVGLDRIPGFFAEEEVLVDGWRDNHLAPAGYIGALEDLPEHLQFWLPDTALPPFAPPPRARTFDELVMYVKRAGYQRTKRLGLGRFWSQAEVPAIRRLIVEPYVRQGGSLAARTYNLHVIDANRPFVPTNVKMVPRD
jgi:hypothetical protein